MLIYCLKCQRKTPTIKVQKIKNRLVGRCKICGGKKSQFVKKK